MPQWKGATGGFGLAGLLDEPAVLASAAVGDGADELGPFRFALLGLARLRRTRARRDRRTGGPRRVRPALRPTCRAARSPTRPHRRRGSSSRNSRRARMCLRDPDGSERRFRVVPMERLDLTAAQPDERVAGAQCVIEERERVVAGEGREPERHLREVDCDRVAIEAVEAALRDEASGEDDLVLIGGDLWAPAVDGPRVDERVTELPARLHKKGGRAHRWVADLEVEDLLRASATYRLLRAGAEGSVRVSCGRSAR